MATKLEGGGYKALVALFFCRGFPKQRMASTLLFHDITVIDIITETTYIHIQYHYTPFFPH